ncbi:gas vesicle protein [Halothece sp. PCC 7418]|uniref:gas vesicle protein GvpG n=1 Tax=Halothece sp. (strain PCC 7418) TaxID=65093 RepID=UPI0002A076F1|nr:gas vesicle protein GvpG [Halothece sp. PCC 7418]AFZ42712.1 gas vesicle protein [Halothece sp. PCC 7418]
MVFKLLLLPITGPIEGVTWLGEQILERANQELDEKENLNKRLLSLQLSLDLGEISEEEYDEQEEEILLAMQAMEDEENNQAEEETD